MGKLKRIWNVISGIFVIHFALISMIIPKDAFLLIALIIAVILMIKGFSYISYYLTMAQHMVGGKTILFSGIIMLDFGVFVGTIAERSAAIIGIYLTAGHAITGGINVVKAVRSRKEGYAWKADMFQGVVNILIALVSLIFMGSVDILVYVYCSGLIYNAATRIITAFRKTAVVYIQ